MDEFVIGKKLTRESIIITKNRFIASLSRLQELHRTQESIRLTSLSIINYISENLSSITSTQKKIENEREELKAGFTARLILILILWTYVLWIL